MGRTIPPKVRLVYEYIGEQLSSYNLEEVCHPFGQDSMRNLGAKVGSGLDAPGEFERALDGITCKLSRLPCYINNFLSHTGTPRLRRLTFANKILPHEIISEAEKSELKQEDNRSAGGVACRHSGKSESTTRMYPSSSSVVAHASATCLIQQSLSKLRLAWSESSVGLISMWTSEREDKRKVPLLCGGMSVHPSAGSRTLDREISFILCAEKNIAKKEDIASLAVKFFIRFVIQCMYFEELFNCSGPAQGRFVSCHMAPAAGFFPLPVLSFMDERSCFHQHFALNEYEDKGHSAGSPCPCTKPNVKDSATMSYIVFNQTSLEILVTKEAVFLTGEIGEVPSNVSVNHSHQSRVAKHHGPSSSAPVMLGGRKRLSGLSIKAISDGGCSSPITSGHGDATGDVPGEFGPSGDAEQRVKGGLLSAECLVSERHVRGGKSSSNQARDKRNLSVMVSESELNNNNLSELGNAVKRKREHSMSSSRILSDDVYPPDHERMDPESPDNNNSYNPREIIDEFLRIYQEPNKSDSTSSCSATAVPHKTRSSIVVNNHSDEEFEDDVPISRLGTPADDSCPITRSNKNAKPVLPVNQSQHPLPAVKKPKTHTIRVNLENQNSSSGSTNESVSPISAQKSQDLGRQYQSEDLPHTDILFDDFETLDDDDDHSTKDNDRKRLKQNAPYDIWVFLSDDED